MAEVRAKHTPVQTRTTVVEAAAPGDLGHGHHPRLLSSGCHSPRPLLSPMSLWMRVPPRRGARAVWARAQGRASRAGRAGDWGAAAAAAPPSRLFLEPGLAGERHTKGLSESHGSCLRPQQGDGEAELNYTFRLLRD